MGELFGTNFEDIRSFTPQQFKTLQDLMQISEQDRGQIGAGGVTGAQRRAAGEAVEGAPTLTQLGLVGHENVQLGKTGVGAGGYAVDQRSLGDSEPTAFEKLEETVGQEQETSRRDMPESGSGNVGGESSPSGFEQGEAFTEAFRSPMSFDPIATLNATAAGLASGNMQQAISSLVGSSPLGLFTTWADLAVNAASMGAMSEAGQRMSDAGVNVGNKDDIGTAAGLAASGYYNPDSTAWSFDAAPTAEEIAAMHMARMNEQLPSTLIGGIGYAGQWAANKLGLNKNFRTPTEITDLAIDQIERALPAQDVVTAEEELDMFGGLESTVAGEVEMGMDAQTQYQALKDQYTALGYDPNDMGLGPTTMGRGMEAWESYEAKKDQAANLYAAKVAAEEEARRQAEIEAEAQRQADADAAASSAWGGEGSYGEYAGPGGNGGGEGGGYGGGTGSATGSGGGQGEGAAGPGAGADHY